MAVASDSALLKTSPELQAALVLDACCRPPARVVVLDDNGYLTRILSAVGYTVLAPGDTGGAEAAACVVGRQASFTDLDKAVALLGAKGFIVFRDDDLVESDLAKLGLAPVPAILCPGGAFSLAVKGHDVSQFSNSAGLQPVRPADGQEPISALDALEKRVMERFDRLAIQNTQMNNSLDRLSYAVSLKSRLVSILRYTGTLEAVASVLARVRKMRGGLTLRRKAASGPIKQLAPGVSIPGPIVIASSAPIADELEALAKQKQIGVTRLAPASPASAEAENLLIRPETESLGGWLALSTPEQVASIKTFMVDIDEGGIAINLLRGRLGADQAMLFAEQSDKKLLPTELGRPDVTQDRLSFYRAAPIVLRDDALSEPDAVGGRNWPKISMVMVSFNQADFLEEGIRSILDQNYPNLEFILIDGGSKDGSVDIIERYRDRLDKVLIEPDRGQSDGLNKGFDLATGEIFSWLNSDDLLLPGALAKVGRAFRSYGADMIVGGCKQVQQDGRTVVVSHHNHLPLGQTVPLPLNELLDFDNRWQGGAFFYQPEVFFSREIWMRSGGGLRVDLYYVLDYDLWIRMAAAGASVAHIPDFLAASRIHDQQKTTFGENPFIPETRRLLAEYATGVHWTRPSDA